MAKLTTAQAAERLGLTRQRVRQLISEGKLKATRFSDVWQIEEEEVDRYIGETRGDIGQDSTPQA